MKPQMFVLFLSLFFIAVPQTANADGTLPRLQIEGNSFTVGDGKPVSLRGVSLCSLEWHKPLDQIERVTRSPFKWNANILRLPVQTKEWKRIGAQAYIKNYLDPAVEMCSKNDVYCIIDWHKIGGWQDAKTAQQVEEFWRLVAPRYARNPNILYEVFNEPTDPKAKTRENWLAWRAKAQGWVDLIRKRAPETVILVGSPHWSQMPSFAVDDPFKGDNLAYVMHLYPNYKQAEWDKLFGAASEKIPVFLSEWGWSSQERARKDVIYGTEDGYGAPLKEYLNARPQIGWTAWSYDPKCGPAMLGPDKDMAEFVRGWLDEGAAKAAP